MTQHTILVVEDNPITRKMMRFALESEGYIVLEAGDGQTALAQAAKQRPDLVVQDYVLPDMDGLQLVEGLRALPGRADVPVLVVTGMVSQLEDLRSRGDELTDFLPKPLEPSRLLEIVATYLRRDSARPGRGRRVLVVDDDPLGLKLAALRLHEAGFKVTTAASGFEALDLARPTPPEAILSDVLMPVMDGFALCAAVRKDAGLFHIPVVLLSSAYVEEPDQRLAREMGATALLPRSPDLRVAIEALSVALDQGGATEPAPMAQPDGLELLHRQRIQLQLERQLDRNDALTRQGAIQAAALSIVRGLAEALAQPGDLPKILGDVLVHCLDAAGLSTGLLYLATPAGKLELHAQAGLPSRSRAAAAACFGHPEVIQAALESGAPRAYVSASPAQEAGTRELLDGLAKAFALLIPFVVSGEPVGVLVLAADAQDLSEPAWLGFARTLAVQFGQTIALGRSLSRGAASESRYRVLLERANDAISVLSREGVILEANPQMAALLGLPRDQVVGAHISQFAPAQGGEIPENVRQFQRVLAAGGGQVEGVALRRGDGTRIQVDFSMSIDEIEGRSYVLTIGRDVTERNRAAAALEEAQQRLHRVVSSSPAVLHSLRVEGDRLVPVWTSENVERLLGFSVEEALARDWWDAHIHPDDRERVLAEKHALFTNGSLVEEYRFADKQGAYHWIRAELRLMRDGSGQALDVVGSWSDISARKRTEAYRTSQHAVTRVLSESGSIAEAAPRLLRILCENLGWAFGGLWEVGPAGDVLACSVSHHEPGPGRDEFVSETRRWAPAPGVGLPGRVWSTGKREWSQDKRQAPDSPRAALAAPANLHAACGIPVRAGERVLGVLEFLSSDAREADEDLIEILSDIGEQIGEFWGRTWELVATQERLKHVVSSSPAVLYTLNVSGRALTPSWVADNLEGVVGYRPEEVTSAEWWLEHVHPEDRDRLLAQADELLDTGHVEREYRLRRKDKAYTWVRDVQKLLRDAAGTPFEVVGSWWPIGDRKIAELRLAESEQQYRLLFAKHPQPLWVFDIETLAFLDVNEAAMRHYGYSRDEFLAMTIKDIRPPDEVLGLLEGLAAPGPPGTFGVWRHRTKAGRTILVEIVSSPILFEGKRAEVVLANDVTDKASLEAQLLQAQKMEAIGQLAGGVAHDFNNLLSVISGYATLLLKDIGSLHPGVQRVEHIRRAAERAADLTRQLLAFSRKQVLEPKVLDLNAVVTGIEPMLRRLIGEDVELVTALARDLGPVKADPGQLEQVIMNLAVNARDAMPRGGSLILETANVDLDASYVRNHADVPAGPYVMLAASDTGQGMDPGVMAHIFEPFFTTKPQGKGTGLGLATVFGIVKQSGGDIGVYSEPGQGTSFKIYLPRLTGQVEAERPATPLTPVPRANETVLLVEDAEALRQMIGEILVEHGYSVLAAPDPAEALNVAELHDGPIHIVLTDVVMPGMSGRQLADRLHEARPETRVVYMSGYTDEAISHHGALDAGMHFLQKPFSASALLRKLRSALGEPSS